MDAIRIGKRVIREAERAGVEASEAYVEQAESVEIEVSDEEVESLQFKDIRGIGVRIFDEGRLGFAHASISSEEMIAELVCEAVANARSCSPDPYNVLPERGDTEEPELDIYYPEQSEIPLAQKIEVAMDIERAAKKYDPRIRKVRQAAYSDTQLEVGIVNSRGIAKSYRATSCSSSVMVVAEEEESVETGWAYHFARGLEDLRIGEVGEEAADKAVSLLGAQGMDTAQIPVVFNSIVGCSFLRLISQALTADAVQKGKSLFRGRLGEAVAGEGVSLIDDGRLLLGANAAPFDDEGVATRRTEVIVDGVLEGFLYDTYTALRDGQSSSTGNGTRSSYRGLPAPGPTNLYLSPGDISRDQLISGIDRGLYVIKVMGMHTADPISGDFSVGISGLRIDKGKYSAPVRGVTLAGNIIDLLQSVARTANDLTFLGGFGAPTLAVEAMTISG